MSNVVITLGDVAFQDFEVPEKISIRGGQRLAVHELIGGGLVVDALGEAAGKISFSGVFAGKGARARAQKLDGATAVGAQLPLVWDSFFYTVIIQTFCAEYEKPWWIPFALTCTIVLDPADLVASVVSSVGNLIETDIGSAIGLTAQAGVGLSLPAAPSLAALGEAQSAISNGIGASNAALSAGAALLAGATDAVSGIGDLTQVVSSAGQLAALSAMAGYVNRAAVNTSDQLS